MALAGAFMLMLLSATIAWRLQTPSSVARPEIVKLIALRGAGGDGSARAPSGRPLILVIEKTDLPSSLTYRVEVVSSSGHPIWSGAAQVTDQSISAHATTSFQPGKYWVRLYSSGDKLRREFGLRIK